MIQFRAYNVIVPIFKIEDAISGGMKAVVTAFGTSDFQQDEYLIAVGAANATEVRKIFEKFVSLGLTFDSKSDRTDDFVVLAKEGIWWEVPWLLSTDEGSWFIADVNAPAIQKQQKS
jgi:hypothetical protein